MKTAHQKLEGFIGSKISLTPKVNPTPTEAHDNSHIAIKGQLVGLPFDVALGPQIEIKAEGSTSTIKITLNQDGSMGCYDSSLRPYQITIAEYMGK